MKPKQIFSVIILLVSIVSCTSVGTIEEVDAVKKAGSVEKNVFIIKPQLHEDTKKLFSGLADRIDKVGSTNLKSIAERFRGLAKGGHGSGFFYIHSDKKGYIITNKHVVEGAISVKIITRDGTQYDQAKILFVDQKADLAVIKAPGNMVSYLRGLSLFKKPLKEGWKINAVGYPGMRGKPIWQITEGNISNKLVEFKGLPYVQHTAPIDPGSSGGPLILAEDGSEYSVVGINTLSHRSGQNRNFSIPVKEVIRVIREAEKTGKRGREEKQHQLIQVCKSLGDEARSSHINFERLANMVSLQMVASKGFSCLKSALKLKAITKLFVVDPILAMKSSIAMRLMLSKRKIRFDRIHYSDISLIGQKNNKPIRTFFKDTSGENTEISWLLEGGFWKISMISDLGCGTNESNKNTSKECMKISEDSTYSSIKTCFKKGGSSKNMSSCFIKGIENKCSRINGDNKQCKIKCLEASVKYLKKFKNKIKTNSCKNISNKQIAIGAKSCIAASSTTDKKALCIAKEYYRYCSQINSDVECVKKCSLDGINRLGKALNSK